MKIAYIAHPISGDVKENINKIVKIVRHINLSESQVVPFVPYLADCLAMDDSNPSHRERGIKNDFQFFTPERIDELWVCGAVSKGVQQEIEWASELGIPVRFYNFEL